MIYFIACRAAKAVKIGVTKKRHYATADASAYQRLSSMQSSCPYPLEILATCDGAELEERAIHERFAHLRIRGEWFRLTCEITSFIDGFHRPIRLPRGWNKGRPRTRSGELAADRKSSRGGWAKAADRLGETHTRHLRTRDGGVINR